MFNKIKSMFKPKDDIEIKPATEPLLTPPERNRDNKPKDYGKVFTGLGRYVSGAWKGYLLAFLLIIVTNILQVFGPRLSGLAIDAIGIKPSDVDMSAVLKFTGTMMLIYILSALTSIIFSKVLIRTVQRTIGKMRQDTFNKIVELPLSYIDTHQAGDLVSRISYDLGLVSQALSFDIMRILGSFITVVGSFIMMLRMSPQLSIIFVILLPIIIGFTIYRRMVTRPLFRLRSKELGRMNAYVEETLSGQKTISAYGKEQFFIDNFDEVNNSSIDAYYRADYQGAFNGPSVSFMSNIALALVSLFGSLAVLDGQFTIGSLSAFVLYSRSFSEPINQIAMIFQDLQSAASAAERVFTLLDEDSEPEDKPDAIELTDVKGKVEFRNVSFSYIPGVPVLENVNFVAEAGSLTAIVGPTGAGKTTIVNLLMRFYDPQEGEILVDDINIKDITRKSLRRAFAMVLQDTWLFSGTIKENIAYGESDVDMEKIEAVAEAAHISGFIEEQAEKYDSVVSDSASNLSQGQKQLLTIARAMLLDAPMLILDEATSNVDSKTELQIQDAMNRLIEGRTSFVIAHRLSTIQNADEILVINAGKIQEQGTHDELLEKDEGIYKNLYDSQFQG
ncbi:ABC transporter ATP-binding protein [Fastidiosipila sanguinis]|nr:ABC transporter ATP-binding protein [Fastidiosipila sanguinis]